MSPSGAFRAESSLWRNFGPWELLTLAGVVFGAHLLSGHNYLLFHTSVEFFAVCIAFAVFVIVLNTHDVAGDSYLDIIGYSYLFVGLLDALHALSFRGLPMFSDYNYYGPQFWIAARYLEAAGMLAAFLHVDSPRKLNATALFLGLSLVTGLMIFAILDHDFPVCFAPKKGLTPFKIVSEYAIVALYLVCLLLLQKKRDRFPPNVFALLRAAIWLMIAMELCFTSYTSDLMSDGFNEVGHLIKICAFYLLYKAIVVSGLRNPLMLVSRQLRDSEEKFRHAFTNSTVGFATVGPDRRVNDANPAICRLIGHDAATLRGKDFVDLVHPDDRAENLALFEKTMRGDMPGFVLENRYLREDGKSVWVRKSVSVARQSDGRVKWFYVLVEDVTDRRQAEHELKELNAGLEARVEQEARAREAAQAQLVQSEKLAALGQLAGGVAHDFNNILQTVIGGASAIERRANDPEKVRLVTQVLRDAALRGAAITRRLLAFARRDELRSETVDIVSLLAGLGELLPSTMGARIKFVIDAPDDLPPAKADRSQLETTLINLCANAADAIAGDGAVTLRARCETPGDRKALAPGPYIRLDAIDTGAGMDEPTCARAVEPFFTTKEVGKGTGLGLSMARGFAEQSGGTLEIASALGKGTTVTLWLPVAQEAATDAAPPSAPPPRAPHGGVLLVDDEAAARDLVAAELTHLGFRVSLAASGAEALDKLDAGEDVALVVSDLAMPEMDGVTFLREALGKRPKLEAIMLTGYAGDAGALALDQALGKPITLLRKPVEASALAHRIAVLLNTEDA